ncbi:hypothetical protein BGX21_001383 [Mortierella sp. AD011]|nr:hypothetical protein BGX20_009707 [Mortierella sp. AD010]KAF9401539.1 hypothetical protein BGX21_001383 [Mortierella sp. AD011]
MVSESDIVQPKPMFRKFCLDVLSATLLSPSVILLSLKYIQQLMINLKESNKIVNTGDGAEYRFFTGALILANKFLDDNTFTNKTWADITGMKIKDVNHLEMQFLNGIDFRLFTSSHHYSEWLASLTQFTSVHMPSQHQVAYQQQAAAAQSPVSPMDHTNSFTESVSARQHGSGSESRHSAQSLSMASISQYIDSVKHLQQKSTSSSRYQRVPSTAYNQTPASSTAHSSQQQFMSLPPPSQGPHSIQQVQSNLSPSTHPHAYQQETQEPARRKRSAVNAFDDSMERSPCYDLGSLPYSNHVPIRRQSHKRFSSSSSLATLMGISTGQDVFQSNGPSPSVQQQRHYQRSHRASSGSLSTPFRGQHQRSVSGSYYIDMTGYASNYGQESSQINLPMPNTFSRSGGIHPLERDQELGHRPPSRTDAYHAPLSMHHGSMATGGRSQAYRPSTPPQYSPNKCETTCHSSGCGSNVSTGPAASYDVDPRLWGPLDSLSLYAITTQAAKRVVAQSKALSSSANGLHMYYPTTLA